MEKKKMVYCGVCCNIEHLCADCATWTNPKSAEGSACMTNQCIDNQKAARKQLCRRLPKKFEINLFRKDISYLPCSNIRLDSLILQLVFSLESYCRNGMSKSKEKQFYYILTVGVRAEKLIKRSDSIKFGCEPKARKISQNVRVF